MDISENIEELGIIDDLSACTMIMQTAEDSNEPEPLASEIIATHDAEEPDDGESEPAIKLNNSNIIKNISFSQNEILWNIMQMHNNGNGFECDMTASKLGFYNFKGNVGEYEIPKPKYLFDVYPMSDEIVKIEPDGKLPLADESISSIVIDLPFVISPKNAPSVIEKRKGSNMIFNRFSSYYPVDDMYKSYFHWISEAYRVLKKGGICVFKTQDTVSGGINHCTESWSYMCASRVGFLGEDKFILNSKARLINASGYKNRQKHARKYTSVFWVFKKPNRLKSKNFDMFKLIEECYNSEQV